MTISLAAGRWRGLKAASLPGDVFGIVACDQRDSFRRMMPSGAAYEALTRMKREIIGALSREASAVLLDAEYGLGAAMEMRGGAGLLFALEKSGYSGGSTYRETELMTQWTADKARKSGADAAKLLVYYHPDSGELASRQESLIKEVLRACHDCGLPLFLEPMSYSLDAEVSKDSAEFASGRADVVIETARRLSRIGPDALKLEFPLDMRYEGRASEWRGVCRRLSEASRVPWVLLSAGVDFEDFASQLRAACESGASGFLAGRAIWKEAVAMSSAEREDFLAGPARERLRICMDIAIGSARPWSEFYAPPPAVEDWYVD